MTTSTIPLRRAYQGEEWHQHFRDDGWGITLHRHAVRSEVHAHRREGLGQTRLCWASLTWTQTRDVVIFTGTYVIAALALLFLALTFAAVLWWGFASL